MVTRLLSLLARNDDVVIDQIEAYLTLASLEAQHLQKALLGRMTLLIGASILALSGVILGGIAIMQWALQNDLLWVVIALPAGMVVAAILGLCAAMRKLPTRPFGAVRGQMQQDVDLVKRLIARDARR